jgi:capsular exopolysaccharide synthesis family protein
MDAAIDHLMDSEQTSLKGGQFLVILRRRAPWIMLCVVLVAAAAYGYSTHKVKVYTATAGLTFNSNPLGQEIAGLSTGGVLDPLAQQASNLELVKLGDAAAETARLLGHGLTAEKVSASVSASAKGESNVIYVSAVSTSPALAAAIADTYVKQFVLGQQSASRRFFRSALRLVEKQLAELSPAQRFSTDALDLQNRVHTLSLLSKLDLNNVEVVGEGGVPSNPSSPDTKRNTILGAVVGVLIGLGLAFLLDGLDHRIREPEELRATYDLPVLGAIPKSSMLGDNRAELSPTEAEAFNLIRAHLRFFNIDRDVRTIVIVSPAPGDGKTTTARHLAEAAARLGSRVLLVEADLRQPTLGKQLDIPPGPGLAGVLIGAIAMGEATQAVELKAAPGEGTTGRTLDVLPAGSVLPPNPGELLASRGMDTVLERAKSTYDFVVIDTPPLTAVSDAFPLLTKVDGVVVVGWIGRSRRDDAEKLHQVLAGSGAPLLGVIANGSKSGAPSPYLTDVKSSPEADSNNGASPSEQLVSSTTD